MKYSYELNVCPPLSIEQIHFEFKGCWVLIYNFIQILKVNYVSKPDQMAHIAVPDLVLHCLLMSHKKDARLMWVNWL